MTYETPEIFELGDAEELTLGATMGWELDIGEFPRIVNSVWNVGGEE